MNIDMHIKYKTVAVADLQKVQVDPREVGAWSKRTTALPKKSNCKKLEWPITWAILVWYKFVTTPAAIKYRCQKGERGGHNERLDFLHPAVICNMALSSCSALYFAIVTALTKPYSTDGEDVDVGRHNTERVVLLTVVGFLAGTLVFDAVTAAIVTREQKREKSRNPDWRRDSTLYEYVREELDLLR